MILEQLSAYTVKIRLLPAELPMLHSGNDQASAEKLLLFLMERAELFSGIPFQSRQVTAELLPETKGGLTVYLTARPMKHAAVRVKAAAQFYDDSSLQACCIALMPHLHSQAASSLYRIPQGKLLVVEHLPSNNRTVQHILSEYAIPCSITTHATARLEEYGCCILQEHAIENIANS